MQMVELGSETELILGRVLARARSVAKNSRMQSAWRNVRFMRRRLGEFELQSTGPTSRTNTFRLAGAQPKPSREPFL
jgi:hypothetical protein